MYVHDVHSIEVACTCLNNIDLMCVSIKKYCKCLLIEYNYLNQLCGNNLVHMLCVYYAYIYLFITNIDLHNKHDTKSMFDNTCIIGGGGGGGY